MAGVYIHIPFCKQLCSYCDFYFSVSLERKNEIMNALLLEMDLRKNESLSVQKPDVENKHYPTLYFGGGTPSVYSPEELKILADKAICLFLPDGVVEFTVEVNPDDLTPEYLKGLRNIGVNRLSIGIQSFIDRDLEWMKRRHTAKQAIESVKNAQKTGFDNISIDLIYGIPGMSLSEWEYNIHEALKLNVQHLSAYHLTIEPQTILGRQQKRGLIKPIDDELSEEQYNLLEKLTTDAGFTHYEISNFAKEGYVSKHNSSYWQQQPYIGIGPSAHSYNGNDLRKWNIANNKKYIDAITTGEVYYEEEHLSLYDLYNEFILTSLRTSKGLDAESGIKDKFGNKFHDYFIQQVKPFLLGGYIETSHNRAWIPSKYFLISDSIINQLIYVE